MFLIFAQNIDCGYTLEPPSLDFRGGSNEYPTIYVLVQKISGKIGIPLHAPVFFKSGVSGGIYVTDIIVS